MRGSWREETEKGRDFVGGERAGRDIRRNCPVIQSSDCANNAGGGRVAGACQGEEGKKKKKTEKKDKIPSVPGHAMPYQK